MSAETGGKSVPLEDNGDGRNDKTDVSCNDKSDLGRLQLTDQQLKDLPVEELRILLRKQENYISALETRNRTFEDVNTALKESEERLKAQVTELSLRERVLMRRLAAKEQDMQEYADQVSEMKLPGGNALKSALLDPAVNILLQKLRHELSETKTKLEDTQGELAAWKFTPDSNTGKRLMARCRQLHQENDELAAMISKGRLAKLESELALQKSFSEEVKKSQSDLDELLQDLDEDVEGMQSTIYFLQQELRKTKQSVANLEAEVATLRSDTVAHVQPKSPTVNGLCNAKQRHSSTDDGTDQPNGSPPTAHRSPSPALVSADSSPSQQSPAPQLDRTKDPDGSGSPARCVLVNNNLDDHRKRTTSCEANDDVASKKAKTDNLLTVRNSDDNDVVLNGEENGGQ